MLYRFRAARAARRLARELRASLMTQPRTWSIRPHEAIDGVTELKATLKRREPEDVDRVFTITVQPSKQLPAVRVLDRCRLACDGGDVWLPLLPRIRLKNCVRLFMAIHATGRD